MEDKQEITDGVGQSDRNCRSGGGWMFPALLLVVLGGAVWFAQREPARKAKSQDGTPPTTAWTLTPQPTGQTVGLTVDFSNGVTKQFAALPWQEAMTLEQLMQQAAIFRPGITFSQQGSGELGFLTSIDGLENQGANGRNWQYRVNDEHGQMSFCLQPLQPGDQVLWGYALAE